MKKAVSFYELIIVMSIMVLLAAITIPAIRYYLPSLRLSSSANIVVAQLRQAQEEAVTTQKQHLIRFDTTVTPPLLQLIKIDGTESVLETTNFDTGITLSIDPTFPEDPVTHKRQVIFSADGGPSASGNIVVTYEGIASKTITITPAGIIKLADAAQAPSAPEASPTPTASPPSQVTYKDIATADVFAIGNPPPIDVRSFLTVPSAKTSDGVCYNKLISASLNIFEAIPPLDPVSNMNIKVFYAYFFNVGEDSQASFLNEIPLIDTGQSFTISDGDTPVWISIDVTAALQGALDPHMLFVLAPEGTGPYGTEVYKGDAEAPYFMPWMLYAGKSDINSFLNAGFTSIHSSDSAHYPYIELVCYT